MRNLTSIIITVTILIGCSQSISDKDIAGNWLLYETTDPLFDDEFQRLVFFPNGKFLSPDDRFNERDTEGDWKLKNQNILINYYEGTGTKFFINDISDSTLTLIEYKGTIVERSYLFIRIPFEQPIKDTLRTGSYFMEQGINELPNIEVTDADTKESLNLLEDSATYFIWINPSYLQKYRFSAKAVRNGILKRTLVKNQYELIVNHLDSTNTLELEVKFEFKEDTIFILNRNWVGESSAEYTDEITRYYGNNILKFRIK